MKTKHLHGQNLRDVLNHQRQGFISSLQSLIFHAGLANSNSSAVSDYRAWLSWKSSDTMEFARNGFKRKPSTGKPIFGYVLRFLGYMMKFDDICIWFGHIWLLKPMFPEDMFLYQHPGMADPMTEDPMLQAWLGPWSNGRHAAGMKRS